MFSEDSLVNISQRLHVAIGIYLGAKVVIWEPPRAISIYYLATWSPWDTYSSHAQESVSDIHS